MKKLFFFLCLLTLFVPNSNLTNSHELTHKERIVKAVYRHSDPKLLLSIIEVESNYNQFAVSKKGAVGLMQVRPSVWGKKLREEGIINADHDLFDIEKNIQAGSYILTSYKANSKNLATALRKYNGSKNNKYSKKVLTIKKKYDIIQ